MTPPYLKLFEPKMTWLIHVWRISWEHIEEGFWPSQCRGLKASQDLIGKCPSCRCNCLDFEHVADSHSCLL